MPELPEVETMARLIAPHVQARTIVRVEAPWERSLGGDSLAEFAGAVVGTRITAVSRRAKYIVMALTSEGREKPREAAAAGAILIHLRMTGRLYVKPAQEGLGPYTRVALELDDGHLLHFDDVRKFGRFTYSRDPAQTLAHLGPEPLGDALTDSLFSRTLRARKRKLKPLLLDQEFIAGLGNIYVDEALHRARLHPLRQAESVRPAQAKALVQAIRSILREAIKREGSSFDTFYRTPEGQPGSYQDQFHVYGRVGKGCRTCGAEIQKLVVGQRGTHICPRCQPAPRRRS